MISHPETQNEHRSRGEKAGSPRQPPGSGDSCPSPSSSPSPGGGTLRGAARASAPAGGFPGPRIWCPGEKGMSFGWFASPPPAPCLPPPRLSPRWRRERENFYGKCRALLGWRDRRQSPGGVLKARCGESTLRLYRSVELPFSLFYLIKQDAASWSHRCEAGRTAFIRSRLTCHIPCHMRSHAFSLTRP